MRSERRTRSEKGKQQVVAEESSIEKKKTRSQTRDRDGLIAFFFPTLLLGFSLSSPRLLFFFLSLTTTFPPKKQQKQQQQRNKKQATNTTGFVPYAGEGFALLLPSKWNPRRQVVTPGVLLSYEDNGDAVNHVDVIARKGGGGDIGSFGGPDKFLNDVVRPLLGEQVFEGATRSEGGFAENKVAAASLLDVQEAKDKSGRNYYKYELLTRTADGNEGGR